VFVEGDGLVCHTGTKSCFTQALAFSAAPAQVVAR